MAISPTTPGVHHVALRVTDLDRSRGFYVDTLGLPVVLEHPGLVIVMAGATPIGLQGSTERTPPGDVFDPMRVGLDHLAIACEEESELHRVAVALSDAGIENTGVKLDETLGKLYVAFKDPDRIAWEFYMA
jgi:catechol 2,3-dioxygenase-like lactoylglutathione lyase family enzyme